MAIYHYQKSALIDNVVVKRQRSGTALATITLKKDTDPEQIEKLRAQLIEHNFSTLIDSAEGNPVIQVRGVKTAEKLLSSSDILDLAKNEVTKQAIPEDTPRKQSYSERVRGSAFFLSALFYDLGNIAFFVSGIQRGRHNPGGKFKPSDISEIMIGASFSVGDILMTRYGKDDGSEELHAASVGLKKYLEEKGIQIPQGDVLKPQELYKSGLLRETNNWMQKHIGSIKCLTEFTGGLFTIGAALRPSHGHRNNGKVVAGALISTAWAATFLLDKPRGHQIFSPDDKADKSLIQKITGNPRGNIARPLAMANNVANLWGSLNPIDGERKQLQSDPLRKHDYIWNVFSACSFLVAHTLFGISGSKRPPDAEEDKMMTQDLVLMAANILMQQPAEVMEASINETAEYISTKLAHVSLTKEQISGALRDKVQSLSKNSWAAHVTNTPLPSPKREI